MTEEKKLLDHQIFSIATLIYARLRRVTGRVIDVLYLAENLSYAEYIIHLAEETGDDELWRLCQRLRAELNFNERNLLAIDDLTIDDEVVAIEKVLPSVEPTEEDVYQAQVSHHYIGALR